MTITEFLLARIAEDESEADYALRNGHPGTAPESGSLWVYEDGYPGVYLVMQPERVLAECKAKRAIVGMWSIEMSEPMFDDDDPPAPLGGSGPETYYETLCILASVYVDHPDYEQGWALT